MHTLLPHTLGTTYPYVILAKTNLTLFLSLTVQTQDSTVMVTTLPPKSGGYTTSLFPANATAKQNIAKIFMQSSKVHASTQMEKHSQYVGY